MSTLAPPRPAATINPDRLRREVGALPALPQAVLQALAALRRADTSAEECAGHIMNDPSMAARTLRLANSAFYGMPGRVATIRDAVHLLGRGTLGALLTAATLTTQFGPGRCAGLDFAAFWRHALGVALAAQALARETGLDEELAFTTGLLHDIGRLVLATGFPAELALAAAGAQAGDTPLIEAERAVLGVDHATVGAMIAGHWHFPPAVVGAITEHHAPGAASQPMLADLVQVADAVAHALNLNADADEAVPDIDAGTWARLGLTPAQCLRVFRVTEGGVAALCQSLGVGA